MRVESAITSYTLQSLSLTHFSLSRSRLLLLMSCCFSTNTTHTSNLSYLLSIYQSSYLLLFDPYVILSCSVVLSICQYTPIVILFATTQIKKIPVDQCRGRSLLMLSRFYHCLLLQSLKTKLVSK
jgi:hypothetical protein